MESRQLIIVGGGPAGLTAGLYASRARLDVLLLESVAVGGQLTRTYRIDNWPGEIEGIGGFDLAERMRLHSRNTGLNIAFATLQAIRMEGKDKILVTDQGEFKALSLIIATGATNALLGVKGEKEYLGRGVSYCATCDAPFYRDMRVAVIGGGETAAEEAIYLTRFAREVKLVHRREQLRASKILQEELDKHKVERILSTVAVEITGQDQVTGLELLDLKTNKQSRLNLDGVFIFVGNIPQTGFAAPGLAKNPDGFIITDQELRTGMAGVFAAGDCRQSPLKQVTTAVGEGALAAFMAQKYLSEVEEK
ncbi:MAG: FAD-dependent oxidoreductase [Desulfarculales bacterium]|jgi:thioredoxin reductase (NADPH)|nr:FAD-dependent oxidoreductase [Desulfarculales bacterium]